MVCQQEFVGGTFAKVVSQDYVDYLVKCGMSKDQALPMLNTRWMLKWFQTSPRVWMSHVTCPDLPQYNSLTKFEHNQEKEIAYPCLGPGKFKFKLVFEEDGFLISAPDTPFGPFDIREKFDEGGNKVTTVAKKWGLSIVEYWERQVPQEGCFRNQRSEGVESFLKALDIPVENEEKVMNNKLIVSKSGNVFTFEEHFEDHKVVNKVKLDEECDYLIMHGMPRIALVTQLGPNTYYHLYRNKEGTEKTEGKWTFTENGAIWVGSFELRTSWSKWNNAFQALKDTKSGAITTTWMERFTNIFGTIRPITILGFEVNS